MSALANTSTVSWGVPDMMQISLYNPQVSHQVFWKLDDNEVLSQALLGAVSPCFHIGEIDSMDCSYRRLSC